MNTVSVVIPSFQRIDRLSPLLQAWLDQEPDQVVIILDGPHVGYRERLGHLLDDSRVVVRELPQNVGLALARIEGLKLATQDIVLIADDDVVPMPGLLDGHRGNHAAGKVDVVVGYMPVAVGASRSRDESATRLYAREYEAETHRWEADPGRILDGLWNGNVSISRSAYLAAEELLPSIDLRYNEDLDLGLRLKAANAVAIFDRTLEARHMHSRSFESFLGESVSRGASVARLRHRWGELPPQLENLVAPSPVSLAGVAVRIGSAVSEDALKMLLARLYQIAGRVHAWKVQDHAARLARRILAYRAYRDSAKATSVDFAG
ncbi:glycosyltransferase family 2 protein [Salinibacterium sp. ZJ450]|uniref:glycosyltransferase family 2 protein n=1 Tax=Salinibacterium sp. ZJ450 TaxID=2708338 RepID=UPI00141EA6FB|nr:glycosyltransferase [Salinibacterium sp. ZJ450]